MDKIYLPFYYNWRDITASLSNATFGKLVREVLLFSETGEVAAETFSGSADIAYKFMVNTIRCSQKRAEAGKKGAQARWNKAKNSAATPKTESSGVKEAEQARIARGEHSHVLLSDEEYSELLSTLGEELLKKSIQFLDDYIEEKHYESDSHLLTIKRWVVSAVKEREAKTPKQPKQRYGNFDPDEAFAAALKRSYEED